MPKDRIGTVVSHSIKMSRGLIKPNAAGEKNVLFTNRVVKWKKMNKGAKVRYQLYADTGPNDEPEARRVWKI